MQMRPLFTVFSGCYNSQNVIHRLFASIESQTFQNFEWIVTDDNSSDNTVSLIEEFIRRNPHIKCRFIRHKVNLGIALSRKEAINFANGEYFVKWDHDDIQSPNQLKKFSEVWDKYKGQNIAAIWCLCKDQNNRIVGNLFPKDEIISDYLMMYSKYIFSTRKLKRERHNCIRLDVHKAVNDYLYEKAIVTADQSPTATDIWSGLALLGHKTVFINESLRQYFIEANRERMSNAGRSKNPERVYIDRKNWINHYMARLPFSDLCTRLRLFMSLSLYGTLAGKGLVEILHDICSYRSRVLVLCFYFPSWFFAKVRHH